MDTNYWTGQARRRVSRRTVLRGAGVAGAGLAGAALIGCGSSNDATATAAAGGTGGAATAAASAAASGTAAAMQPKSGGTYRDAIGGDPTNLDPMKAGSFTTKTFSAYVYSRLMKIDTAEGADPFDRLPTPDAAESVEGQDGQHWTVKLKKGIKFQNIAPVNGREMTAQDVVFSFKRLSDPKSPNGVQVKNVTDVTAVDDYTLKFTLAAPSPEFHELLADANLLYIQPQEADGGFDPSLKPIGSGPFMMTEYVASSKLTMAKHPDYFVKGLPYLDGIEQAIIPENAAVKAQFEAGNVDHASIAANDLLDMKKRYPKFSWEPGTGNGMSWLAFSGKDVSPDAPWRDARVRQAASMAIDRDGLLDLAGNAKALRAAGFDSPILVRWNNIPEPCAFGPRYWLDPSQASNGDFTKYFKHNPDEAKKLLQAAGVTDTAMPYQYTNRYGDTFVSLAEAAGNMLTEAGFKLTPEVQDYNSKYITHTFLGDFQGIVYGLESTLTPGGYAQRLFSKDPANHGRVLEPEMEDLVKKQAVELDPQARTQIFYDMQRKQGDQMYYVPAQSSSTTTWDGFGARVHGVRRTRGYGGGTESVMWYWLDA